MTANWSPPYNRNKNTRQHNKKTKQIFQSHFRGNTTHHGEGSQSANRKVEKASLAPPYLCQHAWTEDHCRKTKGNNWNITKFISSHWRRRKQAKGCQRQHNDCNVPPPKFLLPFVYNFWNSWDVVGLHDGDDEQPGEDRAQQAEGQGDCYPASKRNRNARLMGIDNESETKKKKKKKKKKK